MAQESRESKRKIVAQVIETGQILDTIEEGAAVKDGVETKMKTWREKRGWEDEEL